MMQRISFKHLVFLALLVMSMSLLPSVIVHSAPEDRIVVPPDSFFEPGYGRSKDGQEESISGVGIEAPETLESLRHDLEQLNAELEKEKKTLPPFGTSFVIILAAAALLASVVSIVLSFLLFRLLDKDIRRIKESLVKFEQQIRFTIGGLETEQERLTAQLKAYVQSVQKKQGVFEATSTLKRQESFQASGSSSSFITPTTTELPASDRASRSISDLILAINSRDRQYLETVKKAQLNITSFSNNTIAMGMNEATELEEVAFGGKYVLAFIEDTFVLFPSEHILKQFSTTQPSEGLYDYEQRTVSKAEIIEPAVLEKSGSLWRVIQKGRVAIP